MKIRYFIFIYTAAMLAVLLMYVSVSVSVGTGKVLDTAYEVSECLLASDAKYRRDKSEETKEFYFVVNRMDEHRTISVIEKPESSHYNDILLPYYLFSAGKYQVGDSFFLTLGGKEYEFQVAGYGEDPLMATPTNISLYRSVLQMHIWRIC